VLNFSEPVNVQGGTHTLALNDGGTAVYDAAVKAALHDLTKLAFDYLVSSGATPTPSLVTGFDLHGATNRRSSRKFRVAFESGGGLQRTFRRSCSLARRTEFRLQAIFLRCTAPSTRITRNWISI
jgi:hypothetical protein